MFAIRQIEKVVGDTITIKLPAHFSARRVEVIILPLQDANAQADLQELLLTAPVSSEEDLQSLYQVRDWMNQWSVSEF